MKRDLITLLDYSSAEILSLIDSADRLKKQKGKLRADLKGKSVALVFQKPSNRTRVSFEVGVYELGGHCLYLGPEEINLGKRETTYDVAKTLSRYVHCIVARVFDNKDIVELAQHADVPVINALCDLYHPCQALADIQTIREQFGKFKGLTLAYVGDGNNVFHSLMIACAKVGINVRFAGPKGYDPNARIVNEAKKIAKPRRPTGLPALRRSPASPRAAPTPVSHRASPGARPTSPPLSLRPGARAASARRQRSRSRSIIGPREHRRDPGDRDHSGRGHEAVHGNRDLRRRHDGRRHVHRRVGDQAADRVQRLGHRPRDR